MLKRISIAFVLIAALMLMFAGAAYANFGPHGGYVDDTDSCAGCHRAHSSFADVQWTDALGTEHESALLVGSATSMTEFCNACHGDLAPGASTNVVSGVFDSGPSGPTGVAIGGDNDGVTVAYETESTFDAGLNGGGFSQMPDPYNPASFKASTSAHNMEAGPAPLWGSGNALPEWPNLTCADCHDPHGTSNYRLLKAEVNGETVGGYDVDGETPLPFVTSYETDYPTSGWLKHAPGQTQMQAYKPDYTGGTKILHQDENFDSVQESMSAWCAACHKGYAPTSAATSDDRNYGIYEVNPVTGDAVGTQGRHSHAVDVTLAAGWGPGRALQEQVKEDAMIPLEQSASGSTEFYQDYIGCLTCHRAHGSSADMTGWAAAHLETNTAGTWIPVRDGVPGVNPAKQVSGAAASVGGSALLRANDRGVCERCHNK